MFYVNYPVDKKTPITSKFGWRWIPKKGWHSGLDFGCKRGTPVKACYKGIVEVTGNWGNYGLVVIVKHPTMGNIWSLYAHLGEISVRVGEVVESGTELGFSGNTGFCVGKNGGYHLHLELRVGTNRIAFAVNPEKHLKG